jgi:hypothetical protein
MTKFLVLLFCILFSKSPVSAVENTSMTLANMKGRFDDVLLVIQYNHPHYDSISFIKELYGPLFPNIVFYGEKEHPDVTAIKTVVGVYLPRVIFDVLLKHPNYAGYIFLQDDCLMNVWNLFRLDKEKIWFAISKFPNEQQMEPESWFPDFDRSRATEGFFHATLDGSYCEHWGWWKTEHGLPPLQRAFRVLSNEDKSLLAKNLGEGNVISQWCDMFYFPGKFSKEMLRLSDHFRNVFYELSVPMMFCCLDDISNWEYLKMYWAFPQEHFLSYRTDVDWVHPLKFSKPDQREFAKNLMDEFYQTIPELLRN